MNIYQGIVFVFRIVDHWVFPRTFVVRIVDHFGFPFAFVLRIFYLRRLPLSVFFFVPILGLCSFRFGDVFWNVISAFRLRIFGVGNLHLIYSVTRLLRFWVFDFFCRQKIPIVDKISLFLWLFVDSEFIGQVGSDQNCVNMCQFVSFNPHLLLPLQIFSFITKN